MQYKDIKYPEGKHTESIMCPECFAFIPVELTTTNGVSEGVLPIHEGTPDEEDKEDKAD